MKKYINGKFFIKKLKAQLVENAEEMVSILDLEHIKLLLS
jgi:hypothetical protein